MYNNLQDYIANRIHLLTGDWVDNRNNYDIPLGKALGWQVEQGRYWDLISHDGQFIEAKKTNNGSIIVKLPQLAEIYTGAKFDATHKTLTMVLKTHKNRAFIEEVCILETDSIIEFLNLTDEDADSILRVYHRFGCAIQITISSKHIKEMAKIVIHV